MPQKARILVVEDEQLIVDHLVYSLTQLGYEVVAAVSSADDALKCLQKEKIDLALLDIEIEGQRNGIELAALLKKDYQLPFLYLTSKSDTSTIISATATQPEGYIIKPFSSADLQANIEIALHKINSGTSVDPNIPLPIENYFDDGVFFVKDKHSYYKISISQILYLKALDNYCQIFTNSDRFVLPQTLKKMESKLTSYGFYRCHRSYMINLSMIDRIGEREVQLGKELIPVTRSKYSELLEKIRLL